MFGVGAVVVAALLVLHADRVAHLQGELRPGVLGGVVLAAGQLAALHNLGLWAVSFLSGGDSLLAVYYFNSRENSERFIIAAMFST